MNRNLQDKFDGLIDYLGNYDKVGVACSGGVDSTLLAYACCRALGPERVVILFGDSRLQSTELRVSIEERLTRDLGEGIRIEKIKVDPFSQAAFVKNAGDRCYVCKKNIFRQFIEHLDKLGIPVLFDGTNCDDLHEDRPGLKALEELGVISPLVEASFHKKDIRLAASALGLVCADLPSNSCLATRIEKQTPIDDKLLRSIDAMERFLQKRGYHGCRVRPRTGMVFIELLSKDIERISETGERESIVSYFQRNGYGAVMLDLQGRKC
ncbi:MAG: ATP-dependent sacrificial sulfur transferase LarE [Desulfobacterales bacterium]